MTFQKDGPKRRRHTRRETSPVSRQGWLPGVSNFKEEREARRAGLTGKRGKHRGQGADPMDDVAVLTRIGGRWLNVAYPSRGRASAEREAGPDYFAKQREEERRRRTDEE